MNCFFFSLFLTEDVLQSLVNETSKYAQTFLTKMKDTLPQYSRFKQWKGNVISLKDMKVFIALTFYFGILKKQKRSFCTKNEVHHTPCPSKVMKRDYFLNIFAFLHLCDNATYIKKGQDGYDPRKQNGFFYQSVTERLSDLWQPRQYLLIDEGCIPFKGRIHFKCYNPSKIDKYHMKTFKLVDSSNNYCLKFDLYVGLQDYISGFGKMYDLVFKLLHGYLQKSYIIFMDNFYSSTFLFYNLKLASTGAVGTLRLNRKGIPQKIQQAKLKWGEEKLMSYGKEISMLKIDDRKPVLLYQQYIIQRKLIQEKLIS